MNQVFEGPAIEWFALSPLLVLVGGALGLLLVGSLTPQWPRGGYALVASTTLGASIVLSGFLWVDTVEPRLLIGDSLLLDRYAIFALVAMMVATLMSVLTTNDYLEREGTDAPEPYGLILTALIGGVAMVLANDLIVMFLGLETLSLSFYLLTASDRKRTTSGEAGLKYFILGGFASAFFLYGVAMIFGVSGSTNLQSIAAVFGSEVSLTAGDAMLLAGVALLLVGFAFKVSLVPFHAWTPDVYQGAPTPFTAFMASVGKIVAFAALVRVFTVALAARADDWRPAVWVLAVITLIVGSVLAVVQSDVKRMLAYSSISHAGFILVGLVAASHLGDEDASLGVSSTMAYLAIYAVLVVGTFAVVTAVAGKGDAATSVDAFKGLAKNHPLLALAMTVLLLAQAGVPLTSGFVAKFGVIRAAVGVESYALAIVAMLAAVIAAFLYLRIMVSMWLADGETTVTTGLATRITIGVSVAATLVIGFFPDVLLSLARSVA
jgi:NADH-quinone oxidoreductase subunit N